MAGNPLPSYATVLADQMWNQAIDFSQLRLAAVPYELFHLTRVQELNLASNELTSVPVEITQLLRLTQLNLSWNLLTALPWQLGRMTQLRSLRLEGNSALLESLPTGLMSAGLPKLLAYLIAEGQAITSSRRLHLMLVGAEKAGKTSLCQALLSYLCEPGLTLSRRVVPRVSTAGSSLLSRPPLDAGSSSALPLPEDSLSSVSDSASVSSTSSQLATSIAPSVASSPRPPPLLTSPSLTGPLSSSADIVIRRMTTNDSSSSASLENSQNGSMLRSRPMELQDGRGRRHSPHTETDSSSESLLSTDGVTQYDLRVPLAAGDLVYNIWDFAGQVCGYSLPQLIH
jgi:GTPase SAR1 family protein